MLRDPNVTDLVDTFISTHSSDETFLEGKPIMMNDESGEKVRMAIAQTQSMETPQLPITCHST